MKGARISAILVLAIVSALILVTLPGTTSAFPYRLEGYLKDDAGNPISGADISIRGQIFVFNGTEQTLDVRTATFEDATDGTGHYQVNFGVDEPDGFLPGNSITVFFDDGSREVSESYTIVGERGWLNLTATTPSPKQDYTFPIMMVIIVVVVFILIVALVRMRDKKAEEEEIVEEAKAKVGRRRK